MPSPHLYEKDLTIYNEKNARNTYEMIRGRAGFFWGKNCPQNWENGPKMGQKQGF